MNTNKQTYPLSHAEKRIYLTQKLHPQSSMWNLPYLLYFNEPVDERLFAESVRLAVANNAALRLRFTEVDGDIRQYTVADPDIRIEQIDLRDAGENGLRDWLAVNARRPLPLRDATPCRFAFLRLPGDITGFFYNLHHIIADGGSCALFIEQVEQIYRHLQSGAPAIKFPPGFPEFLDHETRYRDSPQFKQDQQYWNAIFPDIPDPIDLTGRPDSGDLRISRCRRPLSSALTEQMNRFCRETKTSPFRLLLAAWYAVTARITQHDDMVIGTATSNRYPADFDKTIGMFVSSVPIRLTDGCTVSFNTLLRAIRAKFHEFREHDRYPYDCLTADIRERLRETPNLLDHTVVQYMRPATGKWSVEFLCPGESLNTLTVYLDYGVPGSRDNPVTIMADYRADKLSADRTAALLDNLECMLAAALAAPDAPISNLDMLTGTERRKITVEFNSHNTAYPENATAHELFEKQALRAPANIALVYRNRELTYSALNKKANQLARALRQQGIVRGMFVGIMAERSMEIIIAQMAVLKTGAAIMPIDAKYPPDRVQFMLQDSRAPVLLTQKHFLDKITLPAGTRTFDLDDQTLYRGEDSNPDTGAKADDLFALIYTSGSTGTPKGVMLEHRSMVNFFHWYIKINELTEHDAVAKHGGFSFDVSNAEIYPTLLSGATLHIIPDDIRLSLSHLNEYYEKHAIRVAFFTTQLGEQFMELTDNRSLRILHLAGEKLRIYKKRRYRILNGYGPTECAIYATYFMVDRQYDNIPIGQPLPNYKIFILDKYGNPQPIGAPGELCIGGVALARGYLNRPEKTAEVFISNPLQPDERIYKTGDLACWMPDGNILYLGRMDRQVKLRGFRVELGEIEQALLQYPGCREAAVIDRKDAGGRIFLCAYFTADKPVDISHLRGELARTLPEFMIPAHCIQLDAMPINPNGKIDRKKLPEPRKTAGADTEFAAPVTPAEIKLAEIWREILHIEQPGLNDDFFLTGGDSLKAVLLQARIEKHLGVELTLRDLFKYPVLRDMAAHLDTRDRVTSTGIPRTASAEYYPATSAQRQLYILGKLNNIGTTYNIPMQLSLTGKLDRKKLAAALQTLVDRHVVFRTSFKMADGLPVQVAHEHVRLKLEFQAATEDDLPAITAQFIRPFDLEQAPLLRVKLLAIAPERHVLLMDIHHIIFDGISINTFLNELAAAYTGQSLPEPAPTFHDFAQWRAAQINNTRIAGQADYWQQTFDNPPVMDFPADRPHQPGPDFAGATRHFVLDQDGYQQLKRILGGSKVTLHHLLLGALHILTAKYTGLPDIITGTSTGGRFTPDAENILGMFVNTMPVRTNPDETKTFRAYLNEVRDTMLAIYANQEYPLERLYEKLNINRGAGRHPLFDFNFVLQNMAPYNFQAPGLTTEFSILETGTAKFDFSLTAREENEALHFHVEYRRNLFDAETVSRITGHYLRILAAVSANPDITIGEIEMLPPEEKFFLLETINATVTPPPPYATVCEAIAAQAARQPDHIAIVAGEQQEQKITYGELDRAANRLARRLLDAGVPRGAICAVMMDRSAAGVLGMLAVMKAGCAYVGIDAGYPLERVKFILSDTGAKALLGRHAAPESLTTPPPFFDLDDYRDGDVLPANGSRGEFALPAGAADLAYIIFTSGSTGTPKGVAIEHHSMVNFIHWYAREHAMTPAGRCAEFASFSFDVSVVQTFAPLVSGAELHIIPEHLRLSPPELNSYFEQNQITHVHFPTQFAEQFMRMTQNRSLQRMVVGGDALKNYRLGGYRLINEYGPSETTMASTSYNVDRIMDRVPIGKPVANTRVYVLDRHLKLQPLGVPGELYIAGAGVARGYFNRPELTTGKFLPCPFAPGGRMYKTGDLVRMLPDGNLDFISRVDFQVKIRGYRVETGEIEKQIARMPDIRENIVTDRTDPAGGKYLCAYFRADRTIPAEELKTRLAAVLPEYMIPTCFVQLAAIPLNRNGKIDRKALPDPGLTRTTDQGTAPRNPREQMIAAAWEKIFGFNRISVFDNFFNIGGDSLRVISLLAELQPRLRVTAGDLFAWPTIAEQAAHLPELEETIALRLNRLKDMVSAPNPAENPDIKVGMQNYRKQLKSVRDLRLDKRKKYKCILLTGATGTLGIYLLRDLLADGTARIILIVRGTDPARAEARLIQNFKAAFGADPLTEYAGRITVLNGDLPAENLGLAPEQYTRLAAQADCIIHAAADTRHMGEYSVFQRANVQSTLNLLQLARTGTPKDMHHISTTSVGSGLIAGHSAVLFTEFDCDLGQATDHVYIRSKLEAEKALLEARREGLTVNIYRAGNITIDSRTGKFQRNIEENAFFQQLKAYIQLGAAPDQLDERNISFVDQTSRAILTLFDKPTVANRTFHIENPCRIHLSDLLCDPALGLNIRKMPFKKFVDFLAGHFEHKGFRASIERLMLHLGWSDYLTREHATAFIRPTDWTQAVLAKAGFRWPRATARRMRLLVARALHDRIETLKSARALADLPATDLDCLARLARPEHRATGQTVFWEDENNDRLWFVADGALEVSKRSPDGWIGTLYIAGRGAVLGMESLTAAVKARETTESIGETFLLSINRRDLRKYLNQHPRIALALLSELSRTTEQLERLLLAMG